MREHLSVTRRSWRLGLYLWNAVRALLANLPFARRNVPGLVLALAMVPLLGQAESVLTQDGLGLMLTSDGQVKRAVVSERALTMSSAGNGLQVRDVRNPDVPQEHQVQQILSNPPVFRSTIPSLSLITTLRYTPGAEFIGLDIDVQDESGNDRTLEVIYSLPVGGTGWTWWPSPRRPVPIKSGEIPGTDSASVPVGTEGKLSLYPLCALAGENSGLAMAVPPTHPACYQFRYENCSAQVVFYLATSPRSLHSVGKASVRVLLFRFEPAAGLWDAARRLAGFFPDQFDAGGAKPGAAFLDVKAAETDTPENETLFNAKPSSFHALYACPGDADAETARMHRRLGIQSFLRLSPIARLRYFGIYPDSPAYVNSLLNLLGDAAMRAEVQPYFGTRFDIAKVLRESVCRMPTGRPILLDFQADASEKRSLAQRELHFLLNADPSVKEDHAEDASFGAGQRLLRALNEALEANPFLDGVCMQDISRASAFLNFNLDHHRYAYTPLTFSHPDSIPAVYNQFSLYELMLEMRRRFRASEGPLRGKRIWLHGEALETAPIGSLLFLADVISFEPGEATLRAESPSLDPLRVAVGAKPLVAVAPRKLLEKMLLSGDSTQFSTLLRFSTFYGVPLSLDEFWVAPEFEAVRRKRATEVRRFLRLAMVLQAAGWRPVSHAAVSHPSVWASRFGDCRSKTLHFALFNSGSQDADAQVRLDARQLGFDSTGALKIRDLAGNTKVSAHAAGLEVQISLSLKPRECAVLEFGKE